MKKGETMTAELREKIAAAQRSKGLPDTRKCRTCEQTLPISRFRIVRPNVAEWRCKSCETKRTNQWAQQNRERDRERRRNYMYKRAFGITIEDYDRMLTEQRGGCAICGAKEGGTRSGRFCIDHNHSTGKVRGLLCQGCNTAIGLMRDEPGLLRGAAYYVETR